MPHLTNSGKGREIAGMSSDESQKQKKSYKKAQKKWRAVHLLTLMDVCQLKDSELRQPFKKFLRSCATPRWCCARRFWLLRNIHRARFFSISNDCREISGRDRQTTWMRWTSERRSIRLHAGKNGGCSQIAQNSKSECLLFRYVCHSAVDKNGKRPAEPVVPLERNLCGHPLAELSWEWQFEKVFCRMDRTNHQLGNVCVRS